MQLPGQNVTFRSYFQSAPFPSLRINQTNSVSSHVSSYPQTTGRTVTLLSPDSLSSLKGQGTWKITASSSPVACPLSCLLSCPRPLVTVRWSHKPYSMPHFRLKLRPCSSRLYWSQRLVASLWSRAWVFCLLESLRSGFWFWKNPLATGQIFMALASARTSMAHPSHSTDLVQVEGREDGEQVPTHPLPCRQGSSGRSNTPRGSQHATRVPAPSFGKGCCGQAVFLSTLVRHDGQLQHYQ